MAELFQPNEEKKATVSLYFKVLMPKLDKVLWSCQQKKCLRSKNNLIIFILISKKNVQISIISDQSEHEKRK